MPGGLARRAPIFEPRSSIGRVLAGIIAKHASPIEDATDSGGEASMNFESRNPATGELLGVYREHGKAQTDASRKPQDKRNAFPRATPFKRDKELLLLGG
jgi:acyl-CoA reductase-like NAD-dependent aldehyde dehydrogenase